MNHNYALSVPRSDLTISRYRVACIDSVAGLSATDIWGRLGWREIKRRYRRTVLGPFWSTAGLALFVVTLGFVWANLWHKDPRSYLLYLTSGMVCWIFFLSCCTEGCGTFTRNEALTLIKQLRISYVLLACAAVWRNVTVLLHNLCIYFLVCIFAGVSVTWATLLVIPGFALLWLNMIWIVTLLGSACARYRDLQQLVGTLLQISLFLTPIFWSIDQLSGRTAFLAQFNPLYHLIAIVRQPLLGEAPETTHWVVAILMALFGWALTVGVLTKLRHRIVYWL
jgi:ABC-type polysaccharide/polyol phosphate export permease